MSKKFTLFSLVLLMLSADALCFRQTLIVRRELYLSFLPLLLSEIFAAAILVFCVAFFARKMFLEQF